LLIEEPLEIDKIADIVKLKTGYDHFVELKRGCGMAPL
jgi:hypothetical protein